MNTQYAYEQFVFHISSMEDFYPSKNHGPDSGIGSDNGDKRLSTTEVRIQTLNINDGIANARLTCTTTFQNTVRYMTVNLFCGAYLAKLKCCC